MSVDLPKPDSPRRRQSQKLDIITPADERRTNNHCSKLETFPDAFPVDLIGEVGEPDVAHQLFADNTGNANTGTQ